MLSVFTSGCSTWRCTRAWRRLQCRDLTPTLLATMQPTMSVFALHRGRPMPSGKAMGEGQRRHIVAFRAGERVQHSAQTGVSRPVVDDGDSFLDALFSSARQDRGTRQHPLQAEGRRRRTIGWRLAA